MAKAIFFSIPAHGHTNPTIPLVKELVAMGDEVIYYSTDEFKDKIEATGATFRKYNFTQDFDAIKSGQNLGFLYFLLISATSLLVDDLLKDAEIFKPDYIVHDAICPWGRYVAEICNVPAVSSVSTFAYNNRNATFLKTISFIHQIGLSGLKYIKRAIELQKIITVKYGVQYRDFLGTMMNEEDLNIVYASYYFQPDAKHYDAAKYKFVGPSISERKNDSDTTDYSTLKRPLVYISMGTIWKDRISLDVFIDALIDKDYTIVVSGTDTKKDYSHKGNVIMKPHINQLEVLKHCDAFITHGGMNSVSEGLRAKVPLCVYPLQAEQEEVARRVVDLECGVQIKKLTEKEIRRCTALVLNKQEFYENCGLVSASFAEAGGYKKAVAHIHEYVRRFKA